MEFTLEQAIINRERCYKYLCGLKNGNQENLEAVRMSVCALREKLEREKKPLTNADRIRAMSDEELAEFLNECTSDNGPDFCRRLPECDEDLETDALIPLERCRGCLLNWLQQPVKEEQHE